ncbi:MAG: transcriptional regulator [Deltaproteobacteria bacterium HGW-Deltaproteobacteria-13]|jgi:nitrogen regulatory protein P-II 1|nr:MAG: transcriptional regulator [Deltaproteobacteria bacterium HGW-Deltaproteobacteria-13]
MEWKKVVAIIRENKLREVEDRLKDLQVGGISVTRGAGYGEYANLFSSDWCVTHARLEIYCEASRADVIVQAIMDTTHTGSTGDGIVVVIPVERMYRIKTKTEAKPEKA